MGRSMKDDWWFKFEYSKWDDPSLQLCRMETQGFWLRIYIALRKSGKASVTATVEKLSGLAGCSPPEVVRSIAELKSFDVANVTLCNAQSVTRNSLVTLESRSLKRELSSKEKTKLRVQRHRSNAAVTPDVTVQSKSKELEVEKEEEKREEEHAPEIVSTFNKAFPDYRLTIFQQETLEDRIKDEPAWARAVKFWASNNYRPQSIGKLCDYYDEVLAGKHDEPKANGSKSSLRPDVPANDDAVWKSEPDPPCPYCGKEICWTDHRVDMHIQ